MKKLIVISFILALIVGFGIYESIFSYNTYKEILAYCEELELALNNSESEVSANKNVIDAYGKIESKWEEFAKFGLVFGNHAQIKDFSQKLSMLKGYIVEDDKKESVVSLFMLRSTASFLSREFLFAFENIL